MTGSIPFLLEKTESFEKTFTKLGKSKAYDKTFPEKIGRVLKSLLHDSYPKDSRKEPLPSKTKLPKGWTLHKLEIKVGRGNSGQVRLMYLVNETLFTILSLWLYSHEQFKKRPPDKDLREVINNSDLKSLPLPLRLCAFARYYKCP